MIGQKQTGYLLFLSEWNTLFCDIQNNFPSLHDWESYKITLINFLVLAYNEHVWFLF